MTKSILVGLVALGLVGCGAKEEAAVEAALLPKLLLKHLLQITSIMLQMLLLKPHQQKLLLKHQPHSNSY